MLLQAYVSLTRAAQAQERNLLDARQHGIERIEVRKQACRRLCTDARYARNVVDCIAGQREKIGNLIGTATQILQTAFGAVQTLIQTLLSPLLDPVLNFLMTYFRTPTSVGVWETFVVLAAIYFVFMIGGAFAYRVPDSARRAAPGAPQSDGVHYGEAIKTKQFWLIWAVLCLNVSAGIGVIGMASPMLQEIFGASAAVAAGFTGLISLFNIGGRFFWASLSDHIGRKNTYYTFFLLGIALYALAPIAAGIGSKLLFVACFCIILSMYGGGFATVPA